jgi:glycerol-3-phosphate dehydrogenase
MNRALSASSRRSLIHDLEAGTFDLVIIGGGITGAGIAWDAAKRGLKAVLIEQGDFASGTSSRSTKLIHGGLRYLKKGEIRLVKEVGREREWLYGSAPHLLTPAPMLLPLYKGGTFGYWGASVGLAVYDRLAGVLKSERRVMLRAGRAAKQEPLLNGEGLKGAGLYYEYRSDDARLTVEVLKTANKHGAVAVNYMQAADFLYYKSKVCGIKAIDRFTGLEVEIRAKKVVNAAGPWVDLVRAKDHAIRGKTLLLTKGIHLVVSQSKLPVKQAAYFDAPDGRMIFVIPRGKKTYIGTTDTVYNGDPGLVRVTESDRDYLLKAVTAVFPRVKLSVNDVEAMWAGLRPLIHQEGKSPSDISRKDEIWESPSGLITIAGGKLTGFRKMAEKTVDTIADRIASESRQTFAPCTTDRETISGGDPGRCETYEELREQLLEYGVKRGLNAKVLNELLDRYGSNMTKIYKRLAELDKGFRTWKPEPSAAKRSAAPEAGKWPEAGRSDSGGSFGGRRAQAESYPPAAAPDSGRRPSPAPAREGDRGRINAAEPGAESFRREERPERHAPAAPSASAMARKPAIPDQGKMSAGERAAWIEEWNRREQKAAAASNAEERARWIREWNQRKRIAEEELGAPPAAAESMEAEGLDFAATNGGASVEEQWEQEVYADPACPDKTSVPIEDAWRKLEELTGHLKHEERVVKPGKAPEVEMGGYEKAAEEPQRPEAAGGPGLHRLGATGEEWNQPEAEAVQRPSGDYGDWEREAEGDAWQGGADWAAEGNNASAADDSWSTGEQDSWSDPEEADALADYQEASHGQEAETFYQSDSLDLEEADAEDGEGYFHSLEYKLLKAEVQYCVEEEMAVQAADFLIRRTGLLYFDRERAEEIAIDVIEIMAELLDWTEREITDQKLQLAKEWELATTAFKWEQD